MFPYPQKLLDPFSRWCWEKRRASSIPEGSPRAILERPKRRYRKRYGEGVLTIAERLKDFWDWFRALPWLAQVGYAACVVAYLVLVPWGMYLLLLQGLENMAACNAYYGVPFCAAINVPSGYP